ncbi:TPA: tRNA 2-thiouridine(34) synthase MnmA [Candidatus Avacholeplasma faecigallinarum]|nr:tRNA 2-thiouridine(34) synthase MnmA [Candidatus Avacholeplasma faecigallinarum]
MKVILGLSGGVDSSVALKLLKDEGYDVEAMFMRNWDSATNNDILGNPDIDDDVCPQEKDYQDAKRVADQLQVKLNRVDFIEEYWNTVFQYFLNEYKKGRTPNPDIMCNKYIKFNAFLKYASTLGADYIAMGHYARVKHEKDKSYLLRGVDSNKDQTYFLCMISQEQLRKSLFPIGHLTKPMVRQIAKESNLYTAEKKDSTGICFIGERNFKEFLKNYLPAKPGNMVTLDHKVIGKHDGLMYYTIGQRKGLGIGGSNEFGNDAWFVCGKNIKTNELIVGQGHDSKYLISNHCIASECNWITDKPIEGKNYLAKFRYRQNDNEVTLKFLDDNKIEVFYPSGVRAVTPGQAVVIYDGEICLGGAIIDEVYFDNERRMY